MKKLVSILLLSSLFIFNACKDKDCKKDGSCDPEYHKFPLGKALDYLAGKTGSYWIYKNTKTGDLDTQRCTSFVLDTIIFKGKNGYSPYITVEYERLIRSIYSSFNHWSYNDITAKYNPDALRELTCGLERFVAGEGNIFVFVHPFIEGTGSGTGSSVLRFQKVDSTFDLQGKTYFHVAKFDLDKDDIWEEKFSCKCANTIYYWAKGVGLIKKDVKTCNYAWELIDYKIID